MDSIEGKSVGCLGDVNWQAVSAIATFTAVIVALLPIIGNELRRRAIARNLRARLLAQMTLLRPIIARRFTNTKLGSVTEEPLSNDEAIPVKAVEEMFSQAHVLRAKEHDLVTTVIINLLAFRESGPVSPETACSVLELLDQAIQTLEKGGFRRRWWRRLKLPWSSHDGENEGRGMLK